MLVSKKRLQVTAMLPVLFAEQLSHAYFAWSIDEVPGSLQEPSNECLHRMAERMRDSECCRVWPGSHSGRASGIGENKGRVLGWEPIDRKAWLSARAV